MERERLAAERVRLRAVRFWRGPKEGGFGGQCNQLRQSSAMVCCWSSSPRAGGEQPGRRLARKPAKRMWSVEGSEKCDKEGRPWFTPRHRGMLLLDRSSYGRFLHDPVLVPLVVALYPRRSRRGCLAASRDVLTVSR